MSLRRSVNSNLSTKTNCAVTSWTTKTHLNTRTKKNNHLAWVLHVLILGLGKKNYCHQKHQNIACPQWVVFIKQETCFKNLVPFKKCNLFSKVSSLEKKWLSHVQVQCSNIHDIRLADVWCLSHSDHFTRWWPRYWCNHELGFPLLWVESGLGSPEAGSHSCYGNLSLAHCGLWGWTPLEAGTEIHIYF